MPRLAVCRDHDGGYTAVNHLALPSTVLAYDIQLKVTHSASAVRDRRRRTRS